MDTHFQLGLVYYTTMDCMLYGSFLLTMAGLGAALLCNYGQQGNMLRVNLFGFFIAYTLKMVLVVS